MFKSPISVHDDPFQVSAKADVFVIFPPKAIASVVDPTENIPNLAVFTSAISVQEVPFQLSTRSIYVVVYPATYKAAEAVPFPPPCCLPVFKSFFSVQLLPFQSSVSVLFEPGVPPKIIPSAAVAPAAPPNHDEKGRDLSKSGGSSLKF